jgi:Holliday junction resolvase RusA-like endonuclease
MITFRVFGTPAPQGSKRHIGGGRMIEASKKVKPWRQAIVDQAIRDGVSGTALDGSLELRVTFYLQRPKSHLGVRGIRSSAPTLPHRVPDLDKLLRSTCDALTDSQVIVDDARIVRIHAQKVYADEVAPGAIIFITHTTNERYDNE